MELSGPDICCPMFFNTGYGSVDNFWSTVSIWNVNCARATAFSFDTRAGVLVEMSKMSRQKTRGGLEPPTFGFMPNALTYWAITICFEINWMTWFNKFKKSTHTYTRNCSQVSSTWHITYIWLCLLYNNVAKTWFIPSDDVWWYLAARWEL